MTFVLSLIVIMSPSFGALGRICVVVMAFPGYLHI